MLKRKTVYQFTVFFLTFFWVSLAFSATDEELTQAYAAALKDAEIVEAGEIYHNLTPITEDTPNLIWSGEPGNRHVRVVTWTSWTGYDGLVGKTIRMTRFLKSPQSANGNAVAALYETTRDIWVTVAPEVQQFCRENRIVPADLTLRLEQLLGVPPHNGKTRFVEFDVKPEDLFRPSPDPEITDREAQLDFPPGTSEDHRKWFADLQAVSYGENGYPWTRLGYTYDWGKTGDHIGLTEYVIRIGATVNVDSVTLTADYCQAGSSADEWSLYK